MDNERLAKDLLKLAKEIESADRFVFTDEGRKVVGLIRKTINGLDHWEKVKSVRLNDFQIGAKSFSISSYTEISPVQPLDEIEEDWDWAGKNLARRWGVNTPEEVYEEMVSGEKAERNQAMRDVAILKSLALKYGLKFTTWERGIRGGADIGFTFDIAPLVKRV